MTNFDILECALVVQYALMGRSGEKWSTRINPFLHNTNLASMSDSGLNHIPSSCTCFSLSRCPWKMGESMDQLAKSVKELACSGQVML